ncbi:glycosyltransferase [Streptomyces coffeae]|uniref:Glycosyltransferase family 1 protein n=1 Tax=Streptomyces coffeae TaxID=621382 RepID=A0ABS1NRL0_9ACTN|nr:glycosyltransferase [Streptomyces coffeae]MBL1102639.1 glycosyltransferase family 1 protein [Streptomyces coffeae]
MRVLCSITGSTSHARAALPLVRALGEAGHEVLVITAPNLTRVFDGEAARVNGVYTDIAQKGMRLLLEGKLPLPAEFSRFAHDLWASLGCGPQINEVYELLLPIARDFRPDVVLRDGYEFAGLLTAEALDIPHISAPSGSGQFLDPELLLPMLNDRRREAGLPPSDDPVSVYQHGRFDCMPVTYGFARPSAPEAVAYRQPRTVTRGETLPTWLAGLPADRPLVLASMGTGLPDAITHFLDQARQISTAIPAYDPAEPLNTVVQALSTLNCSAVVSSLGMPVDTSLAADNVLVVDHFPQQLLLERAALFLTHGGYNSIRESVRAGVPMAVRPMFADQKYNAERAEELGLGSHVSERGPEAMAQTCGRLLDDPAVKAEADRAREDMLALPGIEVAVAHMERLAS